MGGIYEYRFNLSDIINRDGHYLREEAVLEVLEQIKNDLLSNKVALKGSKFECYFIKGMDLWDDEKGDICEMDSEWASENLENVRTIKGKV